MKLDEFIYKYHKTIPIRLLRALKNILCRFWRKYRILLGEKLGLPVPQEFTMKLEWIKHFDRNPLMVTCADKVKAKDYVSKIIGNEYIIKTLGVFDRAAEIDFDILPNSFVLKTNNASGTNIIVKDKAKLNISEVRNKLDAWVSNRNFGSRYGEWHYRLIEPKILCEEYLETPNGDLPDFKFFCLNGINRYVQYDIGRYTKNKARAIFDRDWKRINMTLFTRNYNGDVQKPKNFEKMRELAEALSKEFKQVRVDFYNVDGRIYFGEMTFFSGDLFFRPRKYDKIWGSYLKVGK